MARLKKRNLRLGTGTDDLNSRDLPANFTPANYTPEQVGTEGTEMTSSHLKGIDVKIGTLGSTTGDIGHTSFSAANNQATLANVTGFAFSNAVVRSFKAIVSVSIDTSTVDLFEIIEMTAVQRGSDWKLSVSRNGDDTGLYFDITNAGQIQYESTNIADWVSTKINFRAWVTLI